MIDRGISVQELVSIARDETEMISIEQAKAQKRNGESLFVDIRDIREIWREGTIPDAEHVPRGMLEYWSDPDSEYHREFMQPDHRIVVFCADGGARSVLATQTLQRLGFKDVMHLEGGFNKWVRSDGKTIQVSQKKYK